MSPVKRTKNGRLRGTYQAKKRKEKKVLYGPYFCPKCTQTTLSIKIKKTEKNVLATCPCGFTYRFEYVSILDPVDYYNQLMDRSN